MPLIDQDENALLNAPAGYGRNPEEAPPRHVPSILETLGAAWRTENELGSFMNREAGLPSQINKTVRGFDPFKFIPDDKRLHAQRYSYANNEAEVQALTRQIDREQADRRTLQQSGLLGVASNVAVGLVSPINFIPLGGTLWRTYRTGGSLLKGALLSAAVAAEAMTVQEAALQSTQVTRTLEESALNIGGAALLGGVVGGVGSKWAAALEARGGKSFDEFAGALEGQLNIPRAGRYGSAELAETKSALDAAAGRVEELKSHGAKAEDSDYIDALLRQEEARANWERVSASPHEVDLLEPGSYEVPESVLKAEMEGDTGATARWLEDEIAAAEADAEVVYSGPGRDALNLDERIKDHDVIKRIPLLNQQDPLIRTMLSESIETRKVVQRLAETPLKYEKNALGIATELPVEATIKQSKAPLAQALKHLDDKFVEYRTQRAAGAGDKLRLDVGDALGFRGQESLSFDDFKRAVGQAMRRVDTHEIPQVAEAARFFRKSVFDPLKDKAVQLELLPPDLEVNTALSYLTRVWNVEKIVAQRDEFFRRNLDWLRQKELDKPVAMRRPDDELEDIVDQIIDRILGTPEGRLPYDLLDDTVDKADMLKLKKGGKRGVAGPMNTRVYDIPDGMVEDFLESDIEYVAKLYERSMAPDLALVERFGSLDLEPEIQAIRRDYADKARFAEKDADRVRIKKQMDADIRDIAAIRDRLRGTYGMPADPSSTFVRTGRVLRSMNFLSLMGGVTLSSIADVARPMMVHGLRRYLNDGLLPLMADFKGFRAAAEEVKLAGTALDMMLDSRMMSVNELADDFGRGSKLERVLGGASTGYGRITGIAQWTSFMKQYSGMMTQSRMLDAALRVQEGTVRKKELSNLAASYINKDMALRIAEQFNRHGDAEGLVKLPNTARWDDREAVKVFRAALAKDVDRIIVTPGVGDKPLWLSSEWGKLLGQFKSFFISASQRVALSGLQERDLGVLNGTVFAVGLGTLSAMMQDKIRSTAPGYKPISKSPEDLILEGVDRAGIGGWLFEMNSMAEKLTRGKFGLSALTGKEQMSRYQSRNVLDSLIGPSGGRLEDAARLSGAAATGDWSQGDVRAVRRVLPLQNLFYMRWLFDSAERGLSESLGVQAD